MTKDEFLVYPIVNSKIAEILNTKGEYLLNDEEISVLMNNQNSKNKNRDPIDLKSGVLANNGQFTVTYHAGWRSGGTSINDTDFLYSELKSFLTIGDTYLPYPCSFFASPDSKSTFHKSAFEAVANLGVRKVVSFRSFNVGVSSLNEVPYFSYYNGSYNSLSYARGHITDTFIFPVSGGAVTITGSVNF
ncbi:hypothetical protein A8C32_13375 [Flavivirga aquatica]|uniref:Uncharacterized protein n=1 Tax=Flavivirga aquatica TaxID=1849968 RepID=A0A1E5TE76_9FLAO|nr:hypothetical protein [Flavivirga aquatica]OEK09686.1 hypothetical protein A8C32_13375 [Flavivirga aquatica]